MSLLMDALKKAEAAKRQGVEAASTTAESIGDPTFAQLSLEPIDGAPETEPATSTTDNQTSARPDNQPAQLPKLPTHLGGLDAEFVAHHEQQKAASKSSVQLHPIASVVSGAQANPPPAKVRNQSSTADSVNQADRDAARNVFDAKAKAPQAGSKKLGLAMGALTLAVTVCSVGYFWWQLQPKSMFADASVAVRPVAPTTPSGAAPLTPAAAPTQGITASPASGQAAAQVANSAAVAPLLIPAPAATRSQTENRKRVETEQESVGEDSMRMVRIVKSPLRINPALVKGFDSFNRGDFVAAKAEYEAVAKAEPLNIEALHGLAAIAIRENRLSVADHFYERILIADPKDATAMSAMINLHSQNDPVAAESRLKGMASEQPGSSSVQFALGNLYASQKRWPEAQQSYFKAYSIDPDNPDILYNLAVSLEHMNQPKLAHQYYVLAIEAAMRRPGQFDIALASARAATLKP